MLKCNATLSMYDTELSEAIEKEKVRQEQYIDLIASENYASLRVLEAQGSVLTNKYAEGYPGKRYYGGCEYADFIEELAIKRAKILFGADYANVQPHSGSQANLAVYMALLRPGDLILGMKLGDGGHLTHGASVNFSGKIYNSISYGLNKNGEIDYNELSDLANFHKPKMIVGGFSAYSGMCNWKVMREISDNVGAYFLVDMSHVAGLVSAGLYPNPILHAHVVTSTTHKTLAGPRGGLILAKNGNQELYTNLNSAVFPCVQGGPLLHVIAGKAVAFKEAMELKFKIYQKQVMQNAQEMSKVLCNRGFNIISGKTCNHLFLIDLINKKLTGLEASEILSRVNIVINKNSVPNDPNTPFVTSGIRIGTPAVTRRGFRKPEVKKLAFWIADVLDNFNNEEVIKSIKNKVLNICSSFPVYK